MLAFVNRSNIKFTDTGSGIDKLQSTSGIGT